MELWRQSSQDKLQNLLASFTHTATHLKAVFAAQLPHLSLKMLKIESVSKHTIRKQGNALDLRL